MEEIYWALFEADEQLIEPKMLIDERVMAPALVAGDVALRTLKQQYIALGPGWHYADLTSVRPVQVILDAHPNAEDIVRIAAEKYARGESIPVMNAEPVYLRDSVSWQKRQRIRTPSSSL